MSFRVTGLSPEPFKPLYGLPDAALAERGVSRLTVDAQPGYPDRVELRDLEPGETVLLLNHVHQPADTPYRASHAVFVREGATAAYDAVGPLPEVLASRTLSLRAFDGAHLMVDAALSAGAEAEREIERMLAEPAVDYIQAHYATRGCYAALIRRA